MKATVFAVILLLATTQVADAGTITVVRHGTRDQAQVALTIDDCYGAKAGQKIRDVLRQYRVNATLFCTGQAAQKNKVLLQGFLADGNEFGNHTVSHKNLPKVSEDEVRHQICDARGMIDDALGAPSTNLFRPPYGHKNQTVLDIAASCGYDYAVLWDVDTRDWSGNAVSDIARIALTAKNGSIVLMHMGPANTPKALPKIIQGLRNRGYNLVTVSQLLATS